MPVTPIARIPAPAQGYWNFVFAEAFLLFFLFIVSRGELDAWVKILIWNPSATPTVPVTGTQNAPATLSSQGSVAASTVELLGTAAGAAGAGVPGAIGGGVLASQVPGIFDFFTNNFLTSGAQ